MRRQDDLAQLAGLQSQDAGVLYACVVSFESMNEPNKALLLAHSVYEDEGWETAARMIIDMINQAGRQYTGKFRRH